MFFVSLVHSSDRADRVMFRGGGVGGDGATLCRSRPCALSILLKLTASVHLEPNCEADLLMARLYQLFITAECLGAGRNNGASGPRPSVTHKIYISRGGNGNNTSTPQSGGENVRLGPERGDQMKVQKQVAASWKKGG